MSGGNEEDGAEKSFDPTPEKLRKAREEGQIPKSNDLNAAAVYTGMLAVALTFGGPAVLRTAESLMALIANAADLSHNMFSGEPRAVMGPALFAAVAPMVVWFIIPAALVLLVLLGQQALAFTPKNLVPKLSRISILSNAKQKFGRSGLFEFAKSATKLAIYCLIAWLFLRARSAEIIGVMRAGPGQVVMAMADIVVDLLLYVALVAISIGGIDFFWQRMEHHRKNMMTRKEIRDEQKDSEGDPEFKQKRRQKGQQIALNSMLADVPEADVVIVNPTHYAVALSWDRNGREPPKCVAKGVDEIAGKIRELAIEHGVPIHSDPPTARALHGILEIGDSIHNEHFAAVAAAIRFADDMRRRARM